MTVPHQFPSLVNGQVQVLLISGSGLSTPNVPLVSKLQGRLDEIGQSVSASVECDREDEHYFYALAEAILGSPEAKGNTEPERRLWLAEKLGILDDRRWFGKIGLPLSGNTPRHRAIARFAVEGRLRAIVSLNWDALLETTLDSVGLGDGTKSPRPWKVTAYARVVESKDIPSLAGEHVFPVIKPHGCVRNLEKLRREFRSTGNIQPFTFKLTKSELENLPVSQSTLIDQHVHGYVAACPLVAIGWRAGEGYLRNRIVQTVNDAPRNEQDAFTLIDLCWRPNHTEIAVAYNKNGGNAFAEVKADTSPTTDDLLQWLQARHALGLLSADVTPAERETLQRLLLELEQPVRGHHIVRWVDGWLSNWVRLCWRAGVMRGIDINTNKTIEPWDIPIVPRDIYVPLCGIAVPRLELKVAAKFLLALGDSLRRFDFGKFPGGFWDDVSRCLFLPLPGWRGTAQPADLAALKPLIEALRGFGFVRKIKLVLLELENAPPEQQLRHQLEAQVRSLMPTASFAAGGALTWADIDTLRGDAHAPVA